MQNADTGLRSKEGGPNPKRVAAGLLNWAKRRGLTPAGRERLRAAALRTRPWDHSTGPVTPAGKARAAANGKRRQLGPVSVRELRAALAVLRESVAELAEARDVLASVNRGLLHDVTPGSGG